MQDYQNEFLDLALELGVLRFGEFTLKSGRVSPYFFNAGLFNTGRAAAALGRYYAKTIAESDLEFDMLFGPAYKGIPLVAITAAALADNHGIDVPFAYNRKEAKSHGEGGTTVNAPIAPGLYEPVHVARFQPLTCGQTVRTQGPGVLAFDGERERTLKPDQEATLTITREGPRVVDVAAALHYAAERGAFKLNLD